MIVIVGCIVVLGGVLTGFMMAGGHIGALIHPSEFVTIGGAALGAMIVMSPKKVLIDVAKGVMQTIKGSPFNKQAYTDLFKALYELFRLARRDGLLALEAHTSDPHHSAIFTKYPKFAGNHHSVRFVCEALWPVIEGTAEVGTLAALLDAEIKVGNDEHHAACAALSKTADALPGFGIVAAVLGIVVTMEAINGPVEEIGHKVGSALVGTFLGILMSYGFIGPVAGRMEALGEAETAYFRTISTMILAFVAGDHPKVAIERGVRGVSTEFRPSREEMEVLFKEAEGGG